MSIVAGVDSSTQSTKVVLRELETGEVVARAAAPHQPTTPPTSEQDPESWWQALGRAMAQLEPHLPSVEAISVAGQQHGLVLVDGDGDVVRPAKLWNDTTSAPQADELIRSLGPAHWADRCGSVPVAAFTITKLAWLLANEPAAAQRVERIMLPHDYLTWRLTDRHVTDRGDASGTGWFDPATGRYRQDLLDHLAGARGDVWLARLPLVVAHDEPAGSLTDEAAAALGLRPGVAVGPGTGDNMGAALGLGLGPADVAISLGTSGTVFTVSPEPTNDPTGTIAGFADATGNYLPLVCTLNATKVTDAVARWCGTTPEGLSRMALSAAGHDATTLPILVPFFDGERTPNLPTATGRWFGLTTETTQPELACSAFDGVLCNLLEGFDHLGRAGIAVDGRAFLIGGGARSPAYRRRAATLLGRPVTVPTDRELVATGAAVQAAAIVGATSSDEVATRWRLGTGTSIGPGGSDGPTVRQRYRRAARQLQTEPPETWRSNPVT